MPKTKRVTLKARLAKAYRDGAEIGFKQGRQEADRLHATLLATQRQQMRAELLRDARLARFEIVTDLMSKMASQIGQTITQLTSLDGRLD